MDYLFHPSARRGFGRSRRAKASPKKAASARASGARAAFRPRGARRWCTGTLHASRLQFWSWLVAARVSGDSRGGIPKAQFAAALGLAGIGAELRAVKGCEQAATPHLPGDCGERVLRAGGARRGILRGVCHATARATVGVADQHPPKLVHRDVIEVQQITARIAATLVPDAAALNGIRWRRINGSPCPAAVVGEGDTQTPHAEEFRR